LRKVMGRRSGSRGGVCISDAARDAVRELTGSTNPLLTEYLVGPCNKCHQIRRSDEASIFSINVRLGDRTGQRASRSYVEGDLVLYRFWNCFR
jgi:hypothetical protein